MAAATSPVVVSPPSKSISPVDSSVAPINEMNTANRIEKDFFFLEKQHHGDGYRQRVHEVYGGCYAAGNVLIGYHETE